MLYYFIKILVSSMLIVGITEASKRSALLGALLASIPLVSLLAMFWLYFDTKDVQKISELSTQIFWLVIPSLAFFISLPIFLKNNVNFYLSALLSIIITVICYFLMLLILKQMGLKAS